MIAQIGPEMTQTVALPLWLIGLACTTFIGLLAVAYGLAKYVAKQIVDSLGALTTAFNNFRDDAPKKFVSHSHFETKTQSIEKEITGINKRVDDVVEFFRDELKSHKDDCPARS